MKRILFVFVLIVFSISSCKSGTPRSKLAQPQSQPAKEQHGSTGLRTPEAITKALEAAQTAYMDGQWGDVVVQATKVIEGAAAPDDYYLAVRLLGIASCNRKDPRPVAFAFKRLNEADKESLISACKQNGLSISETGEVTLSSAP